MVEGERSEAKDREIRASRQAFLQRRTSLCSLKTFVGKTSPLRKQNKQNKNRTKKNHLYAKLHGQNVQPGMGARAKLKRATLFRT